MINTERAGQPGQTSAAVLRVLPIYDKVVWGLYKWFVGTGTRKQRDGCFSYALCRLQFWTWTLNAHLSDLLLLRMGFFKHKSKNQRNRQKLMRFDIIRCKLLEEKCTMIKMSHRGTFAYSTLYYFYFYDDIQSALKIAKGKNIFYQKIWCTKVCMIPGKQGRSRARCTLIDLKKVRVNWMLHTTVYRVFFVR